jgi:glutamate-5-semialdehyde dehydrogenase
MTIAGPPPVTAPGPVATRLRGARIAARALARAGRAARDAALAALADILLRDAASLAAINADDRLEAEALVRDGRLSPSSLQRLTLDAAKIAALADGVRQVAALADPLGRVTLARELDEGLVLRRVSCPIGVVGVVFESRPDALVQIASLAIKSGNAVVLKGGREARRTNRALFERVREALMAAGLPAGALVLLEDREDVDTLLAADADVDLIVPRGSSALVRHVQDHTRIPVLGHAEGVCHVYVDRAADLGRALAVAVDAKVQYASACNAMETLLVHRDVAESFVPVVTFALVARGVTVRADAGALPLAGPAAVPAAPEDFGTEFGDLVCALKVVASLDEAIAHINAHGSRHTDAIVTEDAAARDRFFADVDAAGVFCNASTRFADGFRYGFGAEVGISTGTLHPRGPVGLDGLVTYKYLLYGEGQVVADYSGKDAKAFVHRDL